MLKIKRVYEKIDASDGKMILVDRLWPRGLRKEETGINEWLKELAPSTELRQWFAHDPDKWTEFREKYIDELCTPGKAKLMERIAAEAASQNVTLVYSAGDPDHNNARVLEEVLRVMMAQDPPLVNVN